MRAVVEGLVSAGLSRGREAIDRRRRQRQLQLLRQPTLPYEEPTITVTMAPGAPMHGPVPSLGDGNRDENENAITTATATASSLCDLARSSDWSALLDRCETHPSEASMIDPSTGDTVLHCAVANNPPAAVVTKLLETERESVSIGNDSGRLPLHVACGHRASGRVISSLLEADPETAVLRDASGFCPLHILCDRGGPVASLEVLLGFLLETAVGASTVAVADCVFGRTPLHILNQRKNLGVFGSLLDSLRDWRRRERDAVLSGNWNESDEEKLTARTNDAKDTEFWCKARLLILAEYAACRRGAVSGTILEGAPVDWNEQSIVRACLGIGDCPSSLLEYALLVYNDELSVANGNGDLVLHEACRRCRAPFHEKERIVAEVLWADPKAARVRNNDGKFPLELYLTGDGSASDAGATNDASAGAPKPPRWSETLRSLLSANPLALEALDLDTRLYPMLLARMGCGAEARSDVFDLLRGSSALLVSGYR